MNPLKRFIPGAERWHYRILGVLWALIGVVLLWNIAGKFLPEGITPWIPAMLGMIYLVVGLTFSFEVMWSRWCMFLLVVLPVCLCFYEWASAPPDVDPEIGVAALAGLAFGSYSLCFVLWSLIRIPMNVLQKTAYLVERWNYRLLGAIWILLGVMFLWKIGPVNFMPGPMNPYASVMLTIPCIIVGVAFCLRAKWSRWCMLPLVILQICICFFEWWETSWYDNSGARSVALAGLIFWIYSFWFVIWSLIRIYESLDL